MSSSPATTVVQSALTTARPWSQFFELAAFNLPVSFSESTTRIKRNLFYFSANYAVVISLIIFLSLIFHPAALIVFIVLIVAWFFLYFFRSVPLVLFNYTVDDRVVLGLLVVVSLVAFFLSGVWLNVFVSLLVGGALICLHGAFRGVEDLVDDGGAGHDPYNALLNVAEEGSYGQI